MSFFNYFTDSERGGAQKAIDFKNRMFGRLGPILVKLRIHPDALSYVGLALLVGVVIWFKAHPFRASALIFLYVVNDGLDGSYARYLKRPTQAGAFTDIVADQLGMVVITLGFIQYQMLDGQIGAYYIMIYLIMITFSVIQNAKGIPMQYIFRSKYILYAIYILWAFAKINLAPYLIPVFCLVMTVSVIQSYRRLKRGFRWKYDLPNLLALDHEIRIAGGTPPKFFAPLRIILPGLVAMALLLAGARPQIAAMIERAEHRPDWRIHELPLADDDEMPRAVTAFGDGWLVSTHNSDTHFARVYRLSGPDNNIKGQFSVPWAMSEDHGACSDGKRLYFADRLSRRVYEIDVEDSLARKLASLTGSFDTTLDAPLGCSIVDYQGRRLMLVNEYMHRYKTILVDYKKAMAAGTAKPHIVRWYRNAGFSRGLASEGQAAVEMNSSLWNDIIYVIDIDKSLAKKHIKDGIITTIAAPRWRCRDLSIKGNTLALVDGRRPWIYFSTLPEAGEMK